MIYDKLYRRQEARGRSQAAASKETRRQAADGRSHVAVLDKLQAAHAEKAMKQRRSQFSMFNVQFSIRNRWVRLILLV
ncbi:MAG TPA: hypothetical protein VFU22_07240, partial [Roseiflexaceae bacterium]|nr:hypothetical protein [Roseiflexaceae bacterium]